MALGKIVADFSTTLAAKLSVAETTATLQSATDSDSVALPAGTYFFTINGGNSQKEYISCTLSGTALTAINNVTRQGVQAAGAVREHRVGSSVTITNFAHIIEQNNLLDGTTDFDSTVPLAYDGDPDLTGNNKKFATVKLVEDTIIAGGVDASTTVKGINKMSVAPASATEPIAVGDNDPRVPTTDEKAALAGTSGTAVSAANKLIDADDAATTSTADKVPRANGSGKIDNGWLSNSPTESVTSGDTITGATTPQPVYQNDSTGKFLRCDANDTAAMKYLGFATTSGNDTVAISVQFTGIVSGFAGLSEGEKYYVQDAVGTIGTSLGTNEILVGIAISATQILIQKGSRYASGSLSSTVTTLSSTSTVTTGFRASKISLFGGSSSLFGGGGDVPAYTSGKWSVAGGNDCLSLALTTGYTANTTNILYFSDDSGDIWTATISNITDTTFDVDFVGDASHGGGIMYIVWDAIGDL